MSSIDSTAGCVLQVSFELIDANDNAPRFDTDQTRIHVSEGSLPGASISLQPAEDIDSPVNGVDSYQLVDDTSCAGGAPFDLLVERNADASHDLRLVLQSPGLDRELCDQYRLTVIARDAGTPARSASFVVDLVVTDVNDHRPVFERLVYETEVRENADPATYGPALITVRATDADDGANGLVRYRLSTRSSAEFGQFFGVDAATGAVRLLRAVDHEAVGSVVVLDVLAQDETSDSATSAALASVRVRVRDANDNAPAVKVESVRRGDDEGALRVAENCANGTQIARVTVSDADTGDAGRVDCHLQHHNGVRTHVACC